MSELVQWMHRRRWTIGVGIFFTTWYVLQLGVFMLFGEATARWWFYFEQSLIPMSPGILLAPISHDMLTRTHLGANLLFLGIAGGLAEPYIGKNRLLFLVFGMGYLSIFFANAIAIVYPQLVHFWILAGASGGVLALWGYAGLRLRNILAENLSNGLKWSRQSIETLTALTLLLSIPAITFHQSLIIDQPHSGHLLGLFLGCGYFVVESYLDQTETSETGRNS